MDVMHLEAFVEAVRKGTVSEAAESLHLTQPAVSLRLRKLENLLGVELMRRTNKGVGLTEAGRIAYQESLKILHDYHSLVAKMDSFKKRISGTLTVGATTTIGGYALPCSVFAFQERFPGARIQVKVANLADITRLVKSQEVQIGLIEGPANDGCLITKGIGEDELVLVASPRSRWASREMIGLREFAHLPLIIREKGSATRETLRNALEVAGLALESCRVVLELDSIEAIKAAVEAGRGVSVLSTLAVRKELRVGTLVPIRVEGLSLRRQFYVVHLKGRTLSAVAKEFMAFIKTPSRREFC